MSSVARAKQEFLPVLHSLIPIRPLQDGLVLAPTVQSDILLPRHTAGQAVKSPLVSINYPLEGLLIFH